MVAGITEFLTRKANHVKGLAEGAKTVHKEHLENTNSFVRAISNWAGDTVDPSVAMWDPAIETAERVKSYLRQGELTPRRVSSAARILQVAGEAYADANQTWRRYIKATISGAESVVEGLEFTRDVSFGIAVGIGAVVAFPVVATAAGGGAITTASGAVATGAVVAGGAAARGTVQAGATVLGQAISGSSIDFGDAGSEFVSGAWAGATDVASGLVGFGTGGAVAKGFGKRFTGELATAGQRLFVKTTAAGAGGVTAGGFAGGAKAALEGRSPGEIWEANYTGALWGGALGVGGALVAPLAGKAFPLHKKGSFRLHRKKTPVPSVSKKPDAGGAIVKEGPWTVEFRAGGLVEFTHAEAPGYVYVAKGGTMILYQRTSSGLRVLETYNVSRAGAAPGVRHRGGHERSTAEAKQPRLLAPSRKSATYDELWQQRVESSEAIEEWIARSRRLDRVLARVRKASGIERIEGGTVTSGKKVEGGTMAAADTDIPGVEADFIGRSTRAGGPKSSSKGEFSPDSPRAGGSGHAEEHVLSQIDDAIQTRELGSSDLAGRTVRVHVEVRPCATCMQGIRHLHKAGPIVKFLRKYPELNVVISDTYTGKVVVMKANARGVLSEPVRTDLPMF